MLWCQRSSECKSKMSDLLNELVPLIRTAKHLGCESTSLKEQQRMPDYLHKIQEKLYECYELLKVNPSSTFPKTAEFRLSILHLGVQHLNDKGEVCTISCPYRLKPSSEGCLVLTETDAIMETFRKTWDKCPSPRRFGSIIPDCCDNHEVRMKEIIFQEAGWPEDVTT